MEKLLLSSSTARFIPDADQLQAIRKTYGKLEDDALIHVAVVSDRFVMVPKTMIQTISKDGIKLFPGSRENLLLSFNTPVNSSFIKRDSSTSRDIKIRELWGMLFTSEYKPKPTIKQSRIDRTGKMAELILHECESENVNIEELITIMEYIHNKRKTEETNEE